MSPSENDLRAALHQGEHETAGGLDVDSIVSAGRDRAATRRERLLSGTAVAIVVAAAGIGGGLLAAGNHGTQSGGAANAGASNMSRNAAPAATPPAASSGSASNGTAGTGVVCPTSLPGRVNRGGAQPPGGLTPMGGAASGAGGKLFAKPVDHLVVCVYGGSTSSGGPTASGGQTGALVAGAQADALRTSLEVASKARPRGACPTIVRADERQLGIIGITSNGRALPVVTATVNAVPCRVIVTNGTAVRYGWTPPAAVSSIIRRLAPPTTKALLPHGSPTPS